MFKNYIKIAFRNLWKNKSISSINILGLALGIMCCIIIFLYVQHEFEHDTFHKKANRLYRVVIKSTADNDVSYSPLQPYEVAAAFKENFPSVIRSTGFKTALSWVHYQDHYFEEKFAFVDSTFLSMFTFPLLAGDPTTALNTPNSIVITKEIADKIFGGSFEKYSGLLGKQLHLPKNNADFIITGILASLPTTSSITFSLLVPFVNHLPYSENNDTFGNTSVYLELNSKQPPKIIEQAASPLFERIFAEKITIWRTRGFLRNQKDIPCFLLQPLTDIYLDNRMENSYESQSSAAFSYILSIIAAIILVIACINFITLSIGNAVKREKEISMRKVLGAGKRQFMFQFIGEAFVLSIITMVLGTLFAHLLAPIFAQIIQKDLHLSFWNNWQTPVFFSILLIIISFIIGSYPAFLFSKYQPVSLLKRQTPSGRPNRFFEILMLFQSALSIALIIATLIIFQQLSFMRSSDVGFKKEQIVSLTIPDNFPKNQLSMLKTKLKMSSSIVNAAGSDRNFIRGASDNTIKTGDGRVVVTRFLRVDADYLETLGIELLQGRNFSESFGSDENNSVLVNETFVHEFGWQHPIGMTFPQPIYKDIKPTIIGVVKDFHFDSMRRKIQPLIMVARPDANRIGTLFIRIRPEAIHQTIAYIQKTWQEVASGLPMQYSFLDENLAKQYNAEEQWNKITGIAALFAIFLSSLGLLGLNILAMHRRIKEIGIRKVVGATTFSILSMLSQHVVRLYILANLIAWPVAWYAMNKWLQNFAYRVDLTIWPFLLAGLAALVIAVLTVSIQTIKAATVNPVESLRYE